MSRSPEKQRPSLFERLQSDEILLLDGTIGTELDKHGQMGWGACNLDAPSVVLAIQRELRTMWLPRLDSKYSDDEPHLHHDPQRGRFGVGCQPRRGRVCLFERPAHPGRYLVT